MSSTASGSASDIISDNRVSRAVSSRCTSLASCVLGVDPLAKDTLCSMFDESSDILLPGVVDACNWSAVVEASRGASPLVLGKQGVDRSAGLGEGDVVIERGEVRGYAYQKLR